MCLVVQWCLTLCDPMECSHHIPLSLGVSRQEYCSGLPPLGNLPDLGIEPTSLIAPALAGGFSTTGTIREARRSFIARYIHTRPKALTQW